MFNNPYLNNFNTQSVRDRIDGQIAQLQQLKDQMNQQPSINQTFQLAPSNNGIHYCNNIDDVKKEIVYTDTPFFSNDLSVLWIKNQKGQIRSFELTEIVSKDQKDLIIDSLQLQINQLKEMVENAKSNTTNADESIENKQPTNISSDKSSKIKSKGSNRTF